MYSYKQAGIYLYSILILPAVCSGTFYSQNGDVIMSSDGVKLYCDGTMCPENTDKCTVSKQSINNSQQIERLRKCFGVNGEIVEENRKLERNLSPNSWEINYFAEANHNGVTVSSSPLLSSRIGDNILYNEESKERRKQLREDLQEADKERRIQLEANRQNLQHDLKLMREGLQKNQENLRDDLQLLRENLQKEAEDRRIQLEHSQRNLNEDLRIMRENLKKAEDERRTQLEINQRNLRNSLSQLQENLQAAEEERRQQFSRVFYSI